LWKDGDRRIPERVVEEFLLFCLPTEDLEGLYRSTHGKEREEMVEVLAPQDIMELSTGTRREVAGGAR
jgi:hypothetical protein